MAISEPAKKTRRGRGRGRGGGEANPVDDPLFDALRDKRKQLAATRGIPAYIIFHDSVLRAMASNRPATIEEMGQIQGVGAKKLQTYGEDFCNVVREFIEA